MTVKTMKLAELKPHPDNPNEGDVDAVLDQIARDGWHGVVLAQAPTARRKYARIIAGHTRCLALQRLADDGITIALDGETEPRVWTFDEIAARFDEFPAKGKVPVDLQSYTDIVAARKMIADNQIPRLANTDEARLAKLLQQLAAEDSVAGSGYEDGYLDDLMASLRAEDTRGNIADGQTPKDREDAYGSAAVRTIILPYPTDDYDGVVERLDKLAATWGLDSHAAVVDHALTTCIAG